MFSLIFSASSFVIRVNFLHPKPSLFLYGLLLSLRCVSILVNYYFQVTFNLRATLHVAKITQNNLRQSSFIKSLLVTRQLVACVHTQAGQFVELQSQLGTLPLFNQLVSSLKFIDRFSTLSNRT